LDDNPQVSPGSQTDFLKRQVIQSKYIPQNRGTLYDFPGMSKDVGIDEVMKRRRMVILAIAGRYGAGNF
jgi:hypothetical protein